MATLLQSPSPLPARRAIPKPQKSERKRVIKDKPKTISKAEETKKLDRAIDNLCRLITHWRDGNECVLRHVDGAHCNEIINWSHVIAQGASGYLQQELGNAFDTCGSHNLMHNSAPIVYLLWYKDTFGRLALVNLDQTRLMTFGYQFSLDELRTRKLSYEELYDNRYSMNGANIQQLVEAGYYGGIIRNAWIKEGRI